MMKKNKNNNYNFLLDHSLNRYFKVFLYVNNLVYIIFVISRFLVLDIKKSMHKHSDVFKNIIVLENVRQV